MSIPLGSARERYWPEWTAAYIGIMDVRPVSGPMELTENVSLIETPGHTPGSITVIADTEGGLVACVGDAVTYREDILELESRTSIYPVEMAVILRRIAALRLSLIISGKAAPFKP